MTSQCCALTFTARESWSEHITLAHKKHPLTTSTKEPHSGFHFPRHEDTNHPLNLHKTHKQTHIKPIKNQTNKSLTWEAVQ